VTLDGCCDHRAISPDEDMHRHAVENLAQADALLFGRVTYELMEAGWRPFARTRARPNWMQPWMEPFAHTITRQRNTSCRARGSEVDVLPSRLSFSWAVGSCLAASHDGAYPVAQLAEDRRLGQSVGGVGTTLPIRVNTTVVVGSAAEMSAPVGCIFLADVSLD